jgi:hypothetical protein
MGFSEKFSTQRPKRIENGKEGWHEHLKKPWDPSSSGMNCMATISHLDPGKNNELR